MEARLSGALQADSSRKTEAAEKRLMSSCQQFASILVSFMMKTMHDGSTGDDDEQGLAGGVYQDMLSEQVAKVVAQSNTLGLGSKLYSQLERSMKTRSSQPGAAPGAQKNLSSKISLNKVSNSAE